MGFWNVEGNYAYAVISGTLTIKLKGQSVSRTGTLAYTFAKQGAAWKIEAQAWGAHRDDACSARATERLLSAGG